MVNRWQWPAALTTAIAISAQRSYEYADPCYRVANRSVTSPGRDTSIRNTAGINIASWAGSRPRTPLNPRDHLPGSAENPWFVYS